MTQAPISRAMNLRLAWAIQQVLSQLEVHGETLKKNKSACEVPVFTPWLMPLTEMVALAMGMPCSSVTTPLMPRCTFKREMWWEST